MNITIVRESFLDLLQKSGYFISNRISDLKIFKAVLVTAEQSGINVKSTNINEQFVGEVGGKVFKTGQVLVDFKTLFEVVKNLNTAKINLEKKDNQIIISGTGGEIKLVSLDDTSFPSIEKTKKTTPLSNELFDENVIRLVLLSCATDEARPILTGLCFDFHEKEVRIVGTDGFRMSLYRQKNVTPQLIGKKIVLSGKSLASALKVFESSKMKVLYSEEQGRVVFEGVGGMVSTKVLEGEFPPYDRVVPQNNETRAIFKKDDLFEVVRASSLFAKEGSNMLNLSLSSKEIIVSSVGVGVGEAVFRVGVEDFNGKENKIVFNYRYLLDYLSNVSEKEIIFEMSSAFSPGVFIAKENQNHLHIIMPIRSQE